MFVVYIRNWHQEFYGRFVVGGGGGGLQRAATVSSLKIFVSSIVAVLGRKRTSVCAIRTGTRMTYIFSAPFLTDRPFCRLPWGRGSKEKKIYFIF